MTDTMTPSPEETPVPETALPQEMGNTPPTETPPMDNMPMGEPPAEPSSSEETPSADQPPSATDKSAPTEEGATDVPTFPGQKLQFKGKKGVLEKIADDYVVPISETALDEWVKLNKPEEFKNYIVQVACGMYPTFVVQIKSGLPTRVLLDPYVQVADQVLGEVKTEPNWSDPKWAAALQGAIDPATNRPVPMSLDEWRKHLMMHPGHNWEFTQQAHDKAREFTKALHSSFNGVEGNM